MNSPLTIPFLDGFIAQHTGSALALTWIVGLIAIIMVARYQQAQRKLMEQSLGAMRFELEEHRLDLPGIDGEPRSPAKAGTALNSEPVSSLQFELELDSYRKLWSAMQSLHQSLGAFLRAIEVREDAAEKRLAARSAAMKVRELADNLMPFCAEHVEQLATGLLEKYIHIHLTACAYLDGNGEGQLQAAQRSQPVTLDTLREQTRTVYEHQGKQELMALGRAIRSRLSSLTGH